MNENKMKKKRSFFNRNSSLFTLHFSLTLYGGVAQLGEHLPCKQGVMGSIPIISTNGERERDIPKTEWAHSSGG